MYIYPVSELGPHGCLIVLSCLLHVFEAWYDYSYSIAFVATIPPAI